MAKKKNDAPAEVETITLTMSRPVAEAVQTAAMARKFERSQRRHWPGAKDPHYGEEE